MLDVLVLVEQVFLPKLLGTHITGELARALESRQVPIEGFLCEGGGSARGALQILDLEPVQTF